MTRKQTLLGYTGMPASFPIVGGTQLSAGEAVSIARDNHAAAFDLHTEEADAAWNELHEELRQAGVLQAVKRINDTLTENGTAIDNANDVTAALHERAGLTLWGDLIEASLTEVKALERPWPMMTADQQSDVLERITKRVKAAGLAVIRDLASRGNHSIVCELDSITVKKDAKATLVVPKSGLDQDLLDAVGGPVYLVVGTGMEELKEIKAPAAEPDQADLLGGTLLGGSTLPPSDGNGGGEPDNGLAQGGD